MVAARVVGPLQLHTLEFPLFGQTNIKNMLTLITIVFSGILVEGIIYAFKYALLVGTDDRGV